MSGYYLRYLVVVLRFLPFAIAFLRDRNRYLLFGPTRRLHTTDHRRRAERLTKTMLDLGPAFVKVGQVLSTRPDIVPPVYTEVLESLQDQVPENVGGDPMDVIETDLGDRIDVDAVEPIAGGSLAFVYSVTIDGERMALKVRRPGILEIIERDLAVIRGLLPIVATFLDEHNQYSLENLADDFQTIIRKELDFDRECRMMDEIGENLAELEQVRVPAAYEAYSSDRIIAMEYLEGMKVTRPEALTRAGMEPHEAATLIARTYLQMALVDGVYHADPHPGNLAFSDAGELILYDFGMSQELTPQEQEDITNLYRALVRRDVDGLLHTLIALEVLDPSVDRAVARRVIELVIDNLEGQADITWNDIMTELFANLRHLPIRIPPNVLLLIRAGTVGEGVCRNIDPGFDFVAVARSFLIDHGFIESELETLASEVRAELWDAAPSLVRAPARFDRVFGQLERGELVVRTNPIDARGVDGSPVGVAIIAAALIIASAILVFHSRPFEIVTLLGIVVLGWRYLRIRHR